MATSGLYKIINNFNGKVYYGSSNNLEKRKREHFSYLKRGVHANSHLQKAYNQNPQVFEFVIIAECNENELLNEEQKLLDQHWDRGAKCYNIAKNAWAPRLGRPLSEEVKQKISDSRRGKIVSEETKEKLKEYNTGKVLSQETRDKISSSLKERYKTPGAFKARQQSEETRKKISQSNSKPNLKLRNKLSWASGHKYSDEQKRQIKIKAVATRLANKLKIEE